MPMRQRHAPAPIGSSMHSRAPASPTSPATPSTRPCAPARSTPRANSTPAATLKRAASRSTRCYNQDPSLEQAARSLGATPGRAFRRVTLPLIKPGLITGALLAFVISFDLFNMALLLKGIGITTLPLQLFGYLRYDFDPAAPAVSTLSVVLTIGVVVVLDKMVGLRSLRFG